VPNVKEFRDKILREAHNSAYSIHLGENKMHQNLKATYWWYGMKRGVANMLPFATPARKSRQSINNLLDCCNPCECPSEIRKRLLWISSLDYMLH
jgi:hypothetical protein